MDLFSLLYATSFALSLLSWSAYMSSYSIDLMDITVPPSFEQSGYTSTMLNDFVLDEIQHIYRSAQLDRETLEEQSLLQAKAEDVLSTSGLKSVFELGALAMGVNPIQVKISLIDESKERMKVVVRLHDGGRKNMVVRFVENPKPADVVRMAAYETINLVSPTTILWYHFVEELYALPPKPSGDHFVQTLKIIEEGLKDCERRFPDISERCSPDMVAQFEMAHVNVLGIVGRTEEALQTLNAFIEDHRFKEASSDVRSMSFAIKAFVLMHAQHLEEAQESLSQATQISPNIGKTFAEFGSGHFDRGGFEHANQRFGMAMKLHYSDKKMLQQYAYALKQIEGQTYTDRMLETWYDLGFTNKNHVRDAACYVKSRLCHQNLTSQLSWWDVRSWMPVYGDGH